MRLSSSVLPMFNVNLLLLSNPLVSVYKIPLLIQRHCKEQILFYDGKTEL